MGVDPCENKIFTVKNNLGEAVCGHEEMAAVIDHDHVEIVQSLILKGLQALVQSRVRRQCGHNDRSSGGWQV